MHPMLLDPALAHLSLVVYAEAESDGPAHPSFGRPVTEFPVAYYADPDFGPHARALHAVIGDARTTLAIVCPPDLAPQSVEFA